MRNGAVAGHEALPDAAGNGGLKRRLSRSLGRRRLAAFLLVAPLLGFLLVSFVAPIGDMMWKSIDNPLVGETLPRTVQALRGWDGRDLPPESAYRALALDLAEAQAERRAGRLGVRLNYEMSGARSLIGGTARRAARLEPPYAESLIAMDARWGEPGIWRVIQRESGPFTASYYLAALDLTHDAEGRIVRAEETRRIYGQLFARTLALTATVTILALLLGFPVAFLMAMLPARKAALVMILVLLPFWTSLLVRTTAWIVLLQQQGVLNDLLVAMGVIGEAQRLAMIHNAAGTVIAMTHIMLPFMILPLYSVMRTIPKTSMQAARSLGANPVSAFLRVYLPQTRPGIGAGVILVFIISAGYYITPALVGGQSGQMISNLIAFHMQTSLNWGLAAALGVILLVGVLALFWLCQRLLGVSGLKPGQG